MFEAVSKLFGFRSSTQKGSQIIRPPCNVPGVSVWKRGNRQRPQDPWLLSYREPSTGKRKTLTASADGETTARQALAISRRIDQHRLGQIDARAERMAEKEALLLLGRWVGGEYQPGHLDAYRDWMRAKGRSLQQIHEVTRRAKKMIRLCHWRTFADLTAETLERSVGDVLRQGRNLSPKTCNDYLKAPAQLLRWMVSPKVGRCRYNPLAGVEMFNAAEDRRRLRRALTAEELMRVLDTARKGGNYRRMSGEDRVAYYLLKAHTGFRNHETASLTPQSFDLDAEPPTVTVAAAYSKHRREDVQPILPELAETIRPWLAGKTADERVFPVTDKPCLMWRADLEAAGIKYETAGGIADLYALRHTFATLLGSSGASIKTIQTLMRHSDIRLTARYMHATLADEMQALSNLPIPARDDRREASVLLPTGTDGAQQAAQQPNMRIDRRHPPKGGLNRGM